MENKSPKMIAGYGHQEFCEEPQDYHCPRDVEVPTDAQWEAMYRSFDYSPVFEQLQDSFAYYVDLAKQEGR